MSCERSAVTGSKKTGRAAQILTRSGEAGRKLWRVSVNMKKRVLIEVETERVTIRRTSGMWHPACLICGDAAIAMITAERAALLAGHDLHWLINQLEANSLHYVQAANRVLYICLNSLLTAIESSQALDG